MESTQLLRWSQPSSFSLGSASLETPHAVHQKAVSKKKGDLSGSLGSITNPFESHLPDPEDFEALVFQCARAMSKASHLTLSIPQRKGLVIWIIIHTYWILFPEVEPEQFTFEKFHILWNMGVWKVTADFHYEPFCTILIFTCVYIAFIF